MFWDVVKELGVAGVLVAAVTYLAKRLLTHWMDRDLEVFKGALNREHSIALEQLRSELRQQALEHEVRCRRNDEKIAEHLNGVYVRLLRFYECVCDYVKVLGWSDEAPKEKKLEVTQEANRDFWDYFSSNRLYVPQPLFEKTSAFARRLGKITSDFTRNLERKKEGAPVEPEFWVKADTEANEGSSSVFSSLVAEFQKRLGVFGEEYDGQGRPESGT